MDSRCVRRVGRRFCPGHGGRGETAISTVRTAASRRRRAMPPRATGRRRSTVLHTTRGCRSGVGPQHSSSVSLLKSTLSSSPAIVVVAGPNGAGKTTAAPFLLRDAFGVREYVNADPIAAGLSAFAPESVAFAAGRVMLARID